MSVSFLFILAHILCYFQDFLSPVILEMVSEKDNLLCQHGRALHPDTLVRTFCCWSIFGVRLVSTLLGLGGSPPVC